MSAPVVVGLDFGGTKIAVAVGDATGARLATTTVQSLPADGAHAAMARCFAAADDSITALPGAYHVAAVGAVTFGIPRADRIDLAPAIPGWQDLRFGEILRSHFGGVPVRVGTDVKAAAAAEYRWGALGGVDYGIYLNIGTGLAVAIVVDGVVLRGARGAAGEIGYSVRSVGDLHKRPHERLILEQVVSGKALSALGRRALGRDIGFASDVFEMATSDPVAARLADAFLDELALHVTNLAIAIDPARIVLGGGLAAAWPHLEPPLRRALDAAVPFPPELVLGAFPFDASLMGALAIGLDALASTNGQVDRLGAALGRPRLPSEKG